ncbi:MAG: heparan-alpha-glucosaminide N-acetyltransferase domain-containing protein [Nevskiales bacterium]|nr:heparan-alpha-glucosaminide N-acetyltransferase domain-containing protein [Nevskiales bacterium]
MTALAHRLNSIDRLRGLVIVIMALDHARDMLTAPTTDFATAAVPLFLTRWITHLCAPTFMLLAGIGAYLYGAQRAMRAGVADARRDVARFLLSRGVWLVCVELTAVSFAWNFNLGPGYVLPLQVIWALGLSMVALAGLIWLPRSLLAGLALLMIVGHNALDAIQPAAAEAPWWWLLLHVQGQLPWPSTPTVFVVYPLLPWVGVMALGYALGPAFEGDQPMRARLLVWFGVAVAALFLIVRGANLYGDPRPWSGAGDAAAVLVDFLNTTKYPPSLQYLLMTLGPALILLGWLERARGVWADALMVIGRVPFFFYVLHLYVIHTLALALGAAQGFAPARIAVIFFQLPQEYGLGLGMVYLFWAGIVLALYPACLWFAALKARHRVWWLRYL